MYQVSLLHNELYNNAEEENLLCEDYFQLTNCNIDFFKNLIFNQKNKVKMIIGEKYSGKSHISHIWKVRNNGVYLNCNDQDCRQKIENNDYFIIENIELWIKNDINKLFNILNITTQEYNKNLLLTSQFLPNSLKINMRDLLSRLLIIPIYEIPKPDEELMCKIMQKRFNDVQLKINIQTIAFISKRIPRTFFAINDIFHKIVDFSLEHNIAITTPVVKKIIQNSADNKAESD